MAVYSCQCGLVISTSREHPVCPRCHRVLEDEHPGTGREAEVPGLAGKSVKSEQRAAGVESPRAGSTPAPLGVHLVRSQSPSIDLCRG
jgi:hypothetical protein